MNLRHKYKGIGTFCKISHIIGLLLMMESLFELLCAIPSFFIDNQVKDGWLMLLCGGITLSSGFAMWFPFRKQELFVNKKEGYLIVTLIWIIFSFLGALPLYIGGYVKNYIDAYFETMSGFTTTGASIMNDVECLSYSVGLWRIITEWIGGIGIIVIMLSIIPFVSGGGMALYSAEVAGPTKSKIAPHIKQTVRILLIVYLSLTLIYIIVYWLCGMSFFDAICHSFTTIATGGLSSKNDSAAAFSPLLQYLMIGFMLLSGTNLLFIYMSFTGKFSQVIKSEELRVYYLFVLVATGLIFILTYNSSLSLEETFRNALFMSSSVLTSTGLINCDYVLWPTPTIIIILMLMISGAMSGSTTGGLKIVRMLLLFKNARNTISRGLHSNAFIPITLDKKIVADETLFNIFNMFMLYIIGLVVGALIFVSNGIPLEESVISSASALGTMGPSFGQSGFGNFAHFNDLSKITMSFLMCAGRLEIVTVFSIFTRNFWKR